MLNTCTINPFPASEVLQKALIEVMPVQMSIMRLERPDSSGGQDLVGMNSCDSAETGSAAFCELWILSGELSGTAGGFTEQRRALV